MPHSPPRPPSSCRTRRHRPVRRHRRPRRAHGAAGARRGARAGPHAAARGASSAARRTTSTTRGSAGTSTRPSPAASGGLPARLGPDPRQRPVLRRARSAWTTPGRCRRCSSEVREELRRETGGEPVVIHFLAVPPVAFAPITRGLGAHDLADGARVIFEKPYGTSLESFEKLDALVKEVLARGAGLPHRPLPGQGGRADDLRAALRQPALRLGVEPLEHRAGADRRARGPRRRQPGDVLRGDRRRPRHARHPPLPGGQPGGHGAADGPARPEQRPPGPRGRAQVLPPARPDGGRRPRPVRRLPGHRRRARRTPPRTPSSPPGCGSTPSAGAACRSCCAPASGWPPRSSASPSCCARRSARSPTSSRCRTPSRSTSPATGEVALGMTVKTPGPDLTYSSGRARLNLDDVPGGEGLSPYASLINDALVGDRSLFTDGGGPAGRVHRVRAAAGRRTGPPRCPTRPARGGRRRRAASPPRTGGCSAESPRTGDAGRVTVAAANDAPRCGRRAPDGPLAPPRHGRGRSEDSTSTCFGGVTCVTHLAQRRARAHH